MDFSQVLPPEKMIQIFEYLEPLDKNLCLVNKRFNDIISTHLSKKFKLIWKNAEGKDSEVLLNSIRKFDSVEISDVQKIPAEFIEILQKNEIKSLKIENCRMSSSEFQRIVTAVAESLEEMSIYKSCITDDIGFIGSQPKLDSLVRLDIHYN